MAIEKVVYEDNPAEYERVLRQNLSLNIHTKESLIDIAVHAAIEAERLGIELKKYRTGYIKLARAISFVKQALLFKKSELSDIKEVLSQHFDNADIATFLALPDFVG